MSRIIVIGAGAAGMMAAIGAASEGREVLLLEQNEKAGKKIYITGKGRCNLTNACDEEDFPGHVCTNRKFIYSAFYGFTNQQAMRFFEEQGLRIKTERGNRVFPVSDHSSDVIAALLRCMEKLHVELRLNTRVDRLEYNEDRSAVTGVRLSSGKVLPADAVIVCTGGKSYPSTGSTGDGYRFAKSAGHTVTPLSPSLVPLTVREVGICQALQGLSLKNVQVTVKDGKKTLYEEMGEMLFAHFGVTGPLILTASARLSSAEDLSLFIDLKPALSDEVLERRFIREFEAAPNKKVRNVLGSLYPARLVPVMLERTGISPELPVHDIRREQRRSLLEMTRAFPLTLTGRRGWNEAVITRGGVNVKEIRPDTMESRKVAGLYFAGEVLDIDAVTGGFNLQIAWSTGMAAGRGAAL